MPLHVSSDLAESPELEKAALEDVNKAAINGLRNGMMNNILNGVLGQGASVSIHSPAGSARRAWSSSPLFGISEHDPQMIPNPDGLAATGLYIRYTVLASINSSSVMKPISIYAKTSIWKISTELMKKRTYSINSLFLINFII
eukprot:Gb_40368 [translate_table: standard]